MNEYKWSRHNIPFWPGAFYHVLSDDGCPIGYCRKLTRKNWRVSLYCASKFYYANTLHEAKAALIAAYEVAQKEEK